MIRRNTWIVLLLFVALAALAFYLQRNKPAESAQATPSAAPQFLLDVDEASLQKLTVQSSTGKFVALERQTDGSWLLVEPAAGATDTAMAQAAVVQLATLRVISSPGTLPGLEALNLDKALYTVQVEKQDGSRIVINIGRETPTGSGYYVLVSDKNQVVVAGKTGLDAVIQLVENPPLQATPTAEATVTPVPGEQSGEAAKTATP